MLVYIDNLNAGNSTTYDPVTRSKSTGACRAYDNCYDAYVYLAGLSSAGGHTLIIRQGVYAKTTDYLILDDADFANLTLTCDAGVVVNPASVNEALQIGANSTGTLTVTGGEWKSSVADEALYVQGATVDFFGCIFTQSAGASSHGVMISAGTSNFYNCVLRTRYVSNSYAGFYSTTTANVLLFMCLIVGAGDAQVGAYDSILFNSTGTQRAVNCVILDAHTYGVCMGASPRVGYVYNSIVQGGWINNSGKALYKGTGALHATNNWLISALKDGDGGYIDTALDTDTNNTKTSVHPGFKWQRGGYILPCVDDTADLTYATDLAAALSAYNYKGTFFTNTDSWDSGNTAALRALITGGVMEVASHTRTHSDMTLSGTIFTVTKAAETITIDRTAGTIALSGGGSVSSFRTKTLATIKTELEALGATVTPDAKYNTGGAAAGRISHYCKGECIANGSAVNTVSLLIDNTGATGYYKTEIGDSLTDLATIAGGVTDGQTGAMYACKSFGYPFNAWNSDSRLATIGIGLESGRGNDNTLYHTLVSVDAYSVWCYAASIIKGDGSESSVRQNARAFGFAVVQAGIIAPILAHSTSELTIQQWQWACAEWALIPGLAVTSHILAMRAVKARMDNDGDGTYSKTWSEFNDGRIADTSSCVNAGAWIATVHDAGRADAWGKYVHRLPNIGVDEGAGSPSASSSAASVSSVGLRARRL